MWTGRRAVELGLVDTLGTLRGVLAQRYPDAAVRLTTRRKSLAARLGLPGTTPDSALGPSALVGALGALEHRAAWARFGL